VPLAEAFRTKRAELQHMVGGVLHSRRDALAASMRRVEERVAGVRAARAAIERETRAEYEAVLDRLSAIEARKLATLQGDLAALQSDLDACAALETRISQAAEDAPQMLAQFDGASAACERAAAKPILQGSDVRTDDFPRETVARREQLQQAVAVGRLLRIKDMTLQLYDEEAAAVGQAVERAVLAQQGSEAELRQWMTLAERLSGALRKFDCACHFCGVLLSDTAINTACRRNVRVPPSAAVAAVTGLSSAQPPLDVFGTGRHFFISVDKARISFT
jgi:hypothetical protein